MPSTLIRTRTTARPIGPVRDYRYAEMMKTAVPAAQYKRSARILKDLRHQNSAGGRRTQKAIDITDNTFRRLLKFIRPGVWNTRIEADIPFIPDATGYRADYGSIIARRSCPHASLRGEQPVQGGGIKRSFWR